MGRESADGERLRLGINPPLRLILSAVCLVDLGRDPWLFWASISYQQDGWDLCCPQSPPMVVMKLKQENVCDHLKTLQTYKVFVLKMITQTHSERLKNMWKVDHGAFSIMASEIVRVKSGSQWSILLEVFFPRRHSGFCGAWHVFLTSYLQLQKHP